MFSMLPYSDDLNNGGKGGVLKIIPMSNCSLKYFVFQRVYTINFRAMLKENCGHLLSIQKKRCLPLAAMTIAYGIVVFAFIHFYPAPCAVLLIGETKLSPSGCNSKIVEKKGCHYVDKDIKIVGTSDPIGKPFNVSIHPIFFFTMAVRCDQ